MLAHHLIIVGPFLAACAFWGVGHHIAGRA